MSDSPGLQILAGIREGKVPAAIKSAAAKGALPLEADELVHIQVALLNDEDDAIRKSSQTSLSAVPEDLALSLASNEATDAEVLLFIAKNAKAWSEPAAAVARRGDLVAETLQILCGSQDGEVLSALSANHRALESDLGIAESLKQNPALPSGAKTKLLDFLDEQIKVKERESAPEAGSEEAGPSLEPAKDPFLAALGIDSEVEALLPSLDLDIGALTEKSELLGLDEDDAKLISRLAKMNVGQKLRVALFGTREERSVLVRDSNRTVACAVVKNPKFTEAEAEAVSNSRNVSVDVLRLVARHRDFCHNYAIQHNLVRNPRTPPDISMKFVNILNDRDLKLLLKNRNVADSVRRHSRKIIQVRESRRRVRIGKKH